MPNWQSYFFLCEWSIVSLMQQLLNVTACDSSRNHRRLIWCPLMDFVERAQNRCWKLRFVFIFIFCCRLGVTAGTEAATHSGTRWRSPRWPWPRVCPGRKGDTSGSRPPPCGAGRRRAAHPARPRSTRWRGRCTCTWRDGYGTERSSLVWVHTG